MTSFLALFEHNAQLMSELAGALKSAIQNGSLVDPFDPTASLNVVVGSMDVAEQPTGG